jgi:hypothetical protein
MMPGPVKRPTVTTLTGRPNLAVPATGEAEIDARRKMFRPTVTERFAFLVEEYGCGGPEFLEDGRPNWPFAIGATYTCATFTVEVWLHVGHVEAEANVGVVPVGQPVDQNRWVDQLAYERGLARPGSIPTGARTGYQLRRSLAAQAEVTRQLLRG